MNDHEQDHLALAVWHVRAANVRLPWWNKWRIWNTPDRAFALIPAIILGWLIGWFAHDLFLPISVNEYAAQEEVHP